MMHESVSQSVAHSALVFLLARCSSLFFLQQQMRTMTRTTTAMQLPIITYSQPDDFSFFRVDLGSSYPSSSKKPRKVKLFEFVPNAEASKKVRPPTIYLLNPAASSFYNTEKSIFTVPVEIPTFYASTVVEKVLFWEMYFMSRKSKFTLRLTVSVANSVSGVELTWLRVCRVGWRTTSRYG